MHARISNDDSAPLADESIKVWRYSDFPKSVSMLVNNGLFFSCLDQINKLGDRFEGAITRADEEAFAKKYTPVVRRAAEFHDKTFMRPRVYVNCWHMSEGESAAKLYGKGDQSIAIQSTCSRLRGWLGDQVLLGRIKYIDYQTERIPEAPYALRALRKRKSFEYEQGLRAVLIDEESEFPVAGGVWRKGNLADLVKSVYTAPTAPAWFREAVEEISRACGLTTEIQQSSLDDDPVYWTTESQTRLTCGNGSNQTFLPI